MSLVTTKQNLIAKLKASPSVTNLLNGGAVEVREFEWQGTGFKYPCVRVKINKFQRQTPGASCNIFDVDASIFVFADEASSLIADQIGTEIFNLLDTKSTAQFTSIKATQFGAAWIQESGVWQSEVSLKYQTS